VREARGARGVVGGARTGGGVLAVQRGQQRIVQGLHAQAHAGHAERAVRGEALAGRALRVALHGDLGVGGETQTRRQALEDRTEILRRQQRGRAAAEEDRGQLDGARPRARRGQVDLRAQRGHEARHRLGLVRGGVERAVAAADRAERDVDVAAERGRARRPAA
jgi:hypothetical protein